MPFRTIGDRVHLDWLSPELAKLEAVVCMVFDAWGSYCIVEQADPGELVLRVRHLGGIKHQVTMSVALRRQIAITYPGQYVVKLLSPGEENARIQIVRLESAAG